MTFIFNHDIVAKKSKNNVFLTYTISCFFSILTKYIGQSSITKKKYTPFCSPFNSASNHIWDIMSQRSHGDIAKLEYRRLNEIQYNFIFIFVNFFLKMFSLFKLNCIPVDRA